VRHADDLPYERTKNGTVVKLNTSRRVSAERHRKGVNTLTMDWSVGWIESEEMDIDLFRHSTQ
jgi:hypothetical protein